MPFAKAVLVQRDETVVSNRYYSHEVPALHDVSGISGTSVETTSRNVTGEDAVPLEPPEPEEEEGEGCMKRKGVSGIDREGNEYAEAVEDIFNSSLVVICRQLSELVVIADRLFAELLIECVGVTERTGRIGRRIVELDQRLRIELQDENANSCGTEVIQSISQALDGVLHLDSSKSIYPPLAPPAHLGLFQVETRPISVQFLYGRADQSPVSILDQLDAYRTEGVGEEEREGGEVVGRGREVFSPPIGVTNCAIVADLFKSKTIKQRIISPRQTKQLRLVTTTTTTNPLRFRNTSAASSSHCRPKSMPVLPSSPHSITETDIEYEDEVTLSDQNSSLFPSSPADTSPSFQPATTLVNIDVTGSGFSRSRLTLNPVGGATSRIGEGKVGRESRLSTSIGSVESVNDFASRRKIRDERLPPSSVRSGGDGGAGGGGYRTDLVFCEIDIEPRSTSKMANGNGRASGATVTPTSKSLSRLNCSNNKPESTLTIDLYAPKESTPQQQRTGWRASTRGSKKSKDSISGGKENKPGSDSWTCSWKRSLKSLFNSRSRSAGNLWAAGGRRGEVVGKGSERHEKTPPLIDLEEVEAGEERGVETSGIKRAQSLPRGLKESTGVGSRSTSVEGGLQIRPVSMASQSVLLNALENERRKSTAFGSDFAPTKKTSRLGRSLSMLRFSSSRGSGDVAPTSASMSSVFGPGSRPQSILVPIPVIDPEVGNLGEGKGITGSFSSESTLVGSSLVGDSGAGRRVFVDVPGQPWTAPFSSVRLRALPAPRRTDGGDGGYQSSSGHWSGGSTYTDRQSCSDSCNSARPSSGALTPVNSCHQTSLLSGVDTTHSDGATPNHLQATFADTHRQVNVEPSVKSDSADYFRSSFLGDRPTRNKSAVTTWLESTQRCYNSGSTDSTINSTSRDSAPSHSVHSFSTFFDPSQPRPMRYGGSVVERRTRTNGEKSAVVTSRSSTTTRSDSFDSDPDSDDAFEQPAIANTSTNKLCTVSNNGTLSRNYAGRLPDSLDAGSKIPAQTTGGQHLLVRLKSLGKSFRSKRGKSPSSSSTACFSSVTSTLPRDTTAADLGIVRTNAACLTPQLPRGKEIEMARLAACANRLAVSRSTTSNVRSVRSSCVESEATRSRVPPGYSTVRRGPDREPIRIVRADISCGIAKRSSNSYLESEDCKPCQNLPENGNRINKYSSVNSYDTEAVGGVAGTNTVNINGRGYDVIAKQQPISAVGGSDSGYSTPVISPQRSDTNDTDIDQTSVNAVNTNNTQVALNTTICSLASRPTCSATSPCSTTPSALMCSSSPTGSQTLSCKSPVRSRLLESIEETSLEGDESVGLRRKFPPVNSTLHPNAACDEWPQLPPLLDTSFHLENPNNFATFGTSDKNTNRYTEVALQRSTDSLDGVLRMAEQILHAPPPPSLRTSSLRDKHQSQLPADKNDEIVDQEHDVLSGGKRSRPASMIEMQFTLEQFALPATGGDISNNAITKQSSDTASCLRILDSNNAKGVEMRNDSTLEESKSVSLQNGSQAISQCVRETPGSRGGDDLNDSNSWSNSKPRVPYSPVPTPARLIISSPFADRASFVANPHKRSVCSSISANDFLRDYHNYTELSPQQEGHIQNVTVNGIAKNSTVNNKNISLTIPNGSLSRQLQSFTPQMSTTLPSQSDRINSSNYNRSWYDGATTSSNQQLLSSGVGSSVKSALHSAGINRTISPSAGEGGKSELGEALCSFASFRSVPSTSPHAGRYRLGQRRGSLDSSGSSNSSGSANKSSSGDVVKDSAGCASGREDDGGTRAVFVLAKMQEIEIT